MVSQWLADPEEEEDDEGDEEEDEEQEVEGGCFSTNDVVPVEAVPVSERSELASRKASILAIDLAK